MGALAAGLAAADAVLAATSRTRKSDASPILRRRTDQGLEFRVSRSVMGSILNSAARQ
jgi:hypothetical protein